MPCALAATITATIYADNSFDFYVDGVLVKSDPIDFTPHNAVKFSFDVANMNKTRIYAIVAKDFSTNSGYEYTSTATPQLGDGALRMIFSDGTVSSPDWKCFTTSFGPTAASVAAGCSATNLAPCQLTTTAEPAGWKTSEVLANSSQWSSAKVYTEAEAGWGTAPTYSGGLCSKLTDPLTRADKSPSSLATAADDCLSPKALSWGSSSFIWQGDLLKDNAILCRLAVSGDGTTASSAPAAKASTTHLQPLAYLAVASLFLVKLFI